MATWVWLRGGRFARGGKVAMAPPLPEGDEVATGAEVGAATGVAMATGKLHAGKAIKRMRLRTKNRRFMVFFFLLSKRYSMRE
jgi:hypothetical protein